MIKDPQRVFGGLSKSIIAAAPYSPSTRSAFAIDIDGRFLMLGC
jgi:hypothetical protein